MNDSASLGGGYASARPDPQPTARAVLAAAHAGAPHARLVVLAGPPGVGKSSVAAELIRRQPESLLIDKDRTAGGFILEAAALRGDGADSAYAADHYWQRLRPLEYAGAMRLACDNLVARRQVLLVGGWGPELGIDALWSDLCQRLHPSPLCVLHLDPPAHAAWRARLAARGSRCDAPYFEELARNTGNLPVWAGAIRLSTEGRLENVVQRALDALTTP